MSQEQPQPNTPAKPDLVNAVMARIEREHITPKPYWQFLCQESGVWGLWVASVIVGAVSVSVILYVSVHAGYAFYEATHESALDFLLDVLPFVWAVVFIVMIGLAYFNLRHTKTGYRYPLWLLVVSSLLLSLVGGGLLHLAGFGHLVDAELDKNMPMLRSLSRIETKLWQSPEHGRMVGVFETYKPEQAEAVFAAADGSTWVINTAELMEWDLELLQSGERVRILGVKEEDAAYFHGCAVLPWMLAKPMPLKEIQAERDHVMQRLERHVEKMRERGGERFEEKLEKLEDWSASLGFKATSSSTTTMETAKEMYCPEMPLIERLIPQA